MARLRRSKGAENDFFPGFTDVSEIGIGSLATVYRAREIGTNRNVALKLLNVRDASPRALESFERESVALGAVSSHPNIVTLYRSFRAADGRPVLVLELCRGSIGDSMVDGQGLPVADVVALGIKIAGALETAHRAEILHRDVKPQNILITEFGEPALADFGVAMLQSSTQTTAGLFDFTTLHAAPELLEGGETSAATDVYELASSLYQLIAGKSAFRAYDGESPASVILRILRDPVQPLVNAQVPTRLSDLLVGAMSKDKSDRPPTAVEFATELAEVEAAQGWPRTQFLIRDPDGHSVGLPSVTRMPTLRPPGSAPVGYSRPAVPSTPQWSTVNERDEPVLEPPSAPPAEPSVEPVGPVVEEPVEAVVDEPAPDLVDVDPAVRLWATPPLEAEPEPAVPAEPVAVSGEEVWGEPVLSRGTDPEPAPRRAVRIDDDDWSAPRVVDSQATSVDAPPPVPQPEPPPVQQPIPQPASPQRYPIPPAAQQLPNPGIPGYPGVPEDEGTTSVPTWAFRAPAATGMIPTLPGGSATPPPATAPGELTLDPTSLRRRVTIRSGMQSLTVDEQRLLLRAWFRKTELRWPDVRGFEVRSESGEAGGHLVALTAGGPIDLPATRRTMSDLRYVQALLDAYRARAQMATR